METVPKNRIGMSIDGYDKTNWLQRPIHIHGQMF